MDGWTDKWIDKMDTETEEDLKDSSVYIEFRANGQTQKSARKRKSY